MRCFFDILRLRRFFPRIFLLLRNGLKVGDSSSSSIIIRRLRSFGTLGVVGDIKPATLSTVECADIGVSVSSIDEISISALEFNLLSSFSGGRMACVGGVSRILISLALISIAIGSVDDVIVIVSDAVSIVGPCSEFTTSSTWSVLTEGVNVGGVNVDGVSIGISNNAADGTTGTSPTAYIASKLG